MSESAAARPAPTRRRAAAETLAGLISAAVIFASLVAMAYHPARIAPAAIVLALLAAAIGGRHRNLAFVALLFGILGWLVGMIVAVLTNNAIV